MNSTTIKSDTVGAFASSLCLVHCLATPILFVAQTCSATCCDAESVPAWWGWIDYVFLIVSFFAIYWSTKHTTKNWIKPALWSSWLLLLVVLVNERLALVALPEMAIYVPALALVGLHLYNRKYCQCEKEECSTNA